jgi:methyltransferase (TIGR00027 family)
VPDRLITLPETAYWVAFYRALESERTDAIFRDPFARELAGPRGEEIVGLLPHGRSYGWPMVVRTAVMDEVVLRLAPGIDVVLNLAAGLDARPYRLALPPALRWVEADYPATIEYKARILGNATPRCALERVPIDLADVTARRVLFARVASGAREVLVITEGLVAYLEPEQVGALADDLAAQPSFHRWMTDIASPMVLRMISRIWGKHLDAGSATFRFGPEDAAAFFAGHGWRLAEYRAGIVDAQRVRREFPFAWLLRLVRPSMWQAETGRTRGPMSGVLLLENAKTSA